MTDYLQQINYSFPTDEVKLDNTNSGEITILDANLEFFLTLHASH